MEVPDVTEQQGPVGVIGLGQMGGAMCRTLLRGGWQVVAWDVAPAALDAAVAAGAEPARDPAGVATRAEIMITSVPDVAAVREIALGAHGVVRGECAGRLLVDTSTILPADARDLGAALSLHGVGFLDAPVSGGCAEPSQASCPSWSGALPGISSGPGRCSSAWARR
jgi:3-hydroxyisobutyrate dehydrogenase-like beta-hydroxyacid dehydrogenase